VALSSCGSLGAPYVLFPENKPNRATGPGALVWSAGTRCPGGAGARVSLIGAGDLPGAPAPPRSASHQSIAPRGQLMAASGPHGQIAISGASTNAQEGLLVQGSADGPFATLSGGPGGSDQRAVATAYLGDVALASSHPGVQLRIERYFAHTFGPPVTVMSAGSSPLSALTVAMDFRTDALLAWAQDGELYARDLPGSGVRHRLQRIGPAGSRTHVVALLSDDNRGILMWTEQRGNRTSVYMDYSATGVRFGAPKLLERFVDPHGLAPPTGAVQLIRLSSESVMAAWSGAEAGHWVLRTAAIDQRGLQQVSTISNPAGDALLSALSPGPGGEAIVLWTEPQSTTGGAPDLNHQSLMAARGIDASPGRTIFGAPEQLAGPGTVANATVGLDPATDRAVAVWEGPGGSIDYSIRSENPTG
jgi:hypothetical protein